MRLMAGRILLDGQDIAELQLRTLRSAIGLVPQRAHLFDGTVREQHSSSGKPRLPARQSSYMPQSRLRPPGFIGALPDGYDTFIGDKGVKLSGGGAPAHRARAAR